MKTIILLSNVTDLVAFSYSEGGPLPDDIVKLLDDAWTKVKAQVPYYAQT